jgi:hypothetical protein
MDQLFALGNVPDRSQRFDVRCCSVQRDQDMDGRDEPGHDVERSVLQHRAPTGSGNVRLPTSMWPARDTRNRRGGSCRSRFAIYRMRLLRYM